MLIALTVALAQTACSSSYSVAPPAPQVSIGTNDARHATGRLVVRIRVPQGHRVRHSRRVRYISPATKGMTIAFSGRSTFTRVINLTPSDTRCTGSPLACIIVVTLPPGKYRATVNTYDRAPVAGAIPASAKLLSSARDVLVFIAAGVANSVDFTLGGVPANILVGAIASGSAGTAFSNQSFSVVVKDADGYIVVGPYSTPIAIADSDASGATTIVTAGADSPPAGHLVSSTDTSALSYTGQPILPATITASAGTVRGSTSFLVQLPVFVADSNNNAVKEIPPGCAKASCVTTLVHGYPPIIGDYGVAVDRSGDVFVANYGSTSPTIYGYPSEIPAGCTAAACVTEPPYLGFSHPSGVAVDSSGDLFTAANQVQELPAGCTSTSCTKALGGTAFTGAWGVAVDGSGNLYVSDTFANTVSRMPVTCTSNSCVTTIGGGFDDPEGVAVDGSGNVYVGDALHNAVKEIPPGCSTATCVTTIGGGFSGPSGLAVDVFGNVYVADYGHSAVKEISPGCVTSSCVTTLGGGFSDPAGVAWGV